MHRDKLESSTERRRKGNKEAPRKGGEGILKSTDEKTHKKQRILVRICPKDKEEIRHSGGNH